MCMCVYVYVCVRVCVCACVRVYVRVYVCVKVYTRTDYSLTNLMTVKASLRGANYEVMIWSVVRDDYSGLTTVRRRELLFLPR